MGNFNCRRRVFLIVVLQVRDITGREPWEMVRMGIGKVFQDVRVCPSLAAVAGLESYVLIRFTRFLAAGPLSRSSVTNLALSGARRWRWNGSV